MDYDLSRLSARSFEQLVQALAVRHFGPGVVIFGDGADGGREAIFQGRTEFAPHGRPWRGTCILQAKFRQRPLGTEIDGPWALAALTQELDKFAKLDGGRPRPDFYIFVTNAVLSPRTGGLKDQVYQALRDAEGKWGLRDYDVWDYDKLRTWLDLDAEVRTQFGWITAGDVLAAMLRSIDGADPTFESAITNYLEKTLISDRFVRLEEAGHSTEGPTALSNVFIDLPLRNEEQAQEEFFMRRLLDYTASLRSSDRNARELQRRMVLVGGPGQGKTTVGQFACQIFRASLLSARPEASLSPEARSAIRAIQAACEAEGLPFGRGPRFPLRVALTDLAKALSERERPLLTYLAEVVSVRIGTTVSSEVFRKWLGSHPWFLVLDGLDEVPANAGRDGVMRCITDFWVDVTHSDADVIVLATTRPQGYNNEFSPDLHEHVELAELPADLALSYGARLATVRYGAESDRTVAIKKRLARASDDPTTAHLMRSPLQVAIMTALVDLYGQPPHERWSLFNAYYEVIYQRERERETSAARILREYRPDIDAIHQRVGLALQVLTTHEGHSDPRLTGAQLEQVIEARVASEEHGGGAMVTQIRSAAELRLVFLVGAESDRIGFEIRSLQEFMAACALVDGPDEQVIGRLAVIAPLPSWRNVLLFATGQCFVGRQYLRQQIHSLCRELDVDSADPLVVAVKTGARLALDLLEDRTARRQPKHYRVIAAHALETLKIADTEVPERLARCHDDHLDDLYRDALTAAVTGTDELTRTNARRCLAALNSRGVSWSSQLLYDNFPNTGSDAIDMLEGMPPKVIERLDGDYLVGVLTRATHFEFQRLTSDILRRSFSELSWSTANRTRRIEAGVRGFAFSFVTLGAGSMSHSGSVFPEALDESPTIAVYRATEEFLRRLTPDGLADSLELITERSTPDAWRRCRRHVPWPLAIHLARSDTHETLLTQSRAVRDGHYGDQADWVAAEDDWTRKQRSLHELLTMTMPFPIEAASAAVTANGMRGGLPWLADFHALSEEGDEFRSRRLARVMLWMLGTTGTRYAAPPQMSDVIDVARGAGPELQHWQIGILDAKEASPDECRTLIDALGDRAQIRYVHRPRTNEPDPLRASDEMISRLKAFALDEPSTQSLEVLAVALATRDASVGEPISVPEYPAGSPMQVARAFIELVAGKGTTDARGLGRQFGLAEDSHLASLVHSPLAQRSPGWAAFLVGVHDTTPRRWRDHAVLEDLIREVLSRRESPLADRSTWRDLGLVEPHPLALTHRR